VATAVVNKETQAVAWEDTDADTCHTSRENTRTGSSFVEVGDEEGG
jgi:hypothetical protein